MRRKSIFILLFLILSLLSICLSTSVTANGGYFIDFDEHVHIPEQKAIIFWNGTTEEMILSTRFTSDSINDKAWVIPIQSSTNPEVSEGEIDVFFQAAESFGQYDGGGLRQSYTECFIISIIFLIIGLLCIVLAIKKRGSRYFEVMGVLAVVFLMLSILFFIAYIYAGGMYIGASSDSGVDVIEVKKVDIYDVAILQANTSEDLINWCEENEFNVSTKASSIIDEYCSQDNFYFIINKINLSNVYPPELEKDALKKLEEGIETPLKIRFQPDRPFYPQKMTSINEGNTKMNVYIVSNNDYVDESGILSLRGIESYNGYHPFFDFENSNRIQWFSYEGSTNDLIEDSYFLKI